MDHGGLRRHHHHQSLCPNKMGLAHESYLSLLHSLRQPPMLDYILDLSQRLHWQAPSHQNKNLRKEDNKIPHLLKETPIDMIGFTLYICQSVYEVEH